MRAGDRSCLSYNLQVFNRKDTKTCRYLKANRTLICWLLSRETSFKGRLYNWLPYLKLRASWGQVGNDGIIETPRFVFLPDIKTREGAYVDPSPGGGSIQRYYISSYPNDNINPNRSLETELALFLMTTIRKMWLYIVGS